ncbi:DUF4129 domain-containing protein [Silvibacterium sp.]|uniref:DUF4129 domain-containing protein n=1 Tax=Silvibacterium sp. TaxID=1964179 RepID=UPI0039E57C26
MPRFRSAVRLVLFALALGWPLAGRALPASTLPAYTAHLSSLKTLVDACRQSPTQCDPDKVGGDEQVSGGGFSFDAHYDWLRESLRTTHDPSLKDRNALLDRAARHLDEELRDAGASTSAPLPAQAIQRRDAILARPEYVTVTQVSVWDRIAARLYSWLDRLFGGVAGFGRRDPWVGPVIEWSLVALALTGLALWAMRVLRRQRLRLAVEAGREINPAEEASRNWRELAALHAGAHEWRDAIHCLYWASIVLLEGRRLWAPSRSRTPREYLRLVEPGSARRTLLEQQTSAFERIWYGLEAAVPGDYEQALHLHEELRAA